MLIQTYEDRNPEIMLSISLLVSNRIDTIGKCMESLQPLVNAVPTEIIAVDTGGTDGSIDVVRRYTDKIIKFNWCDDFSAARNAGLKEAKGKWFLFLDDDEWFETTEEIISFLTSGEWEKYGSLQYEVRNYRSFNDLSDYEPLVAARMSRRTKELQFEGKIHEHLNPNYAPVKYVNDYAHHYGYVFDSPEEKEKHIERNVILLKKELEKNPHSIKDIMQLGQEYMFDNNLDESELMIDKGIVACLEQNEDYYINWLICSKAGILKAKGKTEEFIAFVKKWMEYKLSELSKAGLCAMMVDILYIKQENQQGIKYGKKYFAFTDWLLKDEQRIRSQSVLGMLQNVDLNHYTTVQGMLAVLYMREEQWNEAWRVIKKVKWEIQNENVMKLMLTIFQVAEKAMCFGELKEVMNQILISEKMEDRLSRITERVKSRQPEFKEQILDLFIGVKRESSYILLQKLLSAQNHNNSQDMQLYFNRYLKLPYEERVYYADFLWVAIWEGLDAQALIEILDLDHWESAVTAMKAFAPCSMIGEFVEKMAAQMNQEDIKFLYAKMVLFSGRLEEEMNYFFYLDDFLSSRSEYLDKIANEVENSNEISVKQEAVKILRQAVHGFQAEEISQAKELIQEAIRLDSELEKVVVIFLERLISTLKEEHGKMVINTNPEFIYLANQLKEKIRILLARGKKDEALELIKALQSMMPGDQETEGLYKACI